MRNGLIVYMLIVVFTAASQTQESWDIDAGFTFSHFQQQVKAEIGDERGERLVNELEVGVMALGTYRVWRFVSAGIFLQYDRGNRHAARFSGFEVATGKTVTMDKIGGNYNEFWAGPVLRVHWKELFGEFGYGLLGSRNDDARSDLKSSTGDSTGTLELMPAVAFYASLGGAFTILERLDLVVRMEYRLRYYDKRAGNPFQASIEHGTQNITPFIGLRFRF
ncbi:MAG: hypothetical protein WEB33_12770 [Bacteroidota bacterium]